MKNLQAYLDSGVLELFALGLLDREEALAVELLAQKHVEIREELAAIQSQNEEMAIMAAINPPKGSKEQIMSALDALAEETIPANRPPILSSHSCEEDYSQWLDHPENITPPEFENLHYIPIAQNEDGVSLIVWIRNAIEPEVHHDSIEKFLVLEGSCDIEFSGKVYSLNVGDHLSIPLHTPHTVTITSKIPCKLIVQRIAA